MSDENIILFPTDRIKNKENVGVKDTRFQKRIEKEQTTKFIESAVDDIALKLLHNFVDLAMKTQSETFTKDFSFLVDVLRSTIKGFWYESYCTKNGRQISRIKSR